MDQAAHNKIVSFIWGIADDVLRDLDAAGQAFYNTPKFTLRDLRSRGSHQQLRQDFEDYLDGFSPNVQNILENFKFRNQISTLSKADAIGALIEKFLDPEINLRPHPVLNSDGSIKLPSMDNHSMGTVFEELVRKFNEDNNEEAGEHWTPRDAVKLMANLIFLPIADKIQSGSYYRFPSLLLSIVLLDSCLNCLFIPSKSFLFISDANHYSNSFYDLGYHRYTSE